MFIVLTKAIKNQGESCVLSTYAITLYHVDNHPYNPMETMSISQSVDRSVPPHHQFSNLIKETWTESIIEGESISDYIASWNWTLPVWLIEKRITTTIFRHTVIKWTVGLCNMWRWAESEGVTNVLLHPYDMLPYLETKFMFLIAGIIFASWVSYLWFAFVGYAD